MDACSSARNVEDLNRECFCIGADLDAIRAELHGILKARGQPADLLDSHPHLFSSLPVFVSRRHITQVERVVSAIEEVVQSAIYQSAVLAWAPDIAQFDPGSPGGLLGLDFHLSPDGPRLIEINTNPGGILLNALLGEAQKVCVPNRMVAPADPANAEQGALTTILTEWQLQRGGTPLASVAIVDETPQQQYLYPELVLFQELFQRHGLRADIHAPADLVTRSGRIWAGAQPVDMVYNRLTDFALHEPTDAPLRAAYLAGEVVLSPHPRAHALYADKRNLSLLGDRSFLQSLDITQAAVDALVATVPLTTLLTSENREMMWTNRRKLFFKPAAGFGSKASYRGDKMTRGVWEDLRSGSYVAQEIVAPSERRIDAEAGPLKVDIRCYAYRGVALLYAARMYRGQTTNFRTPGGGFAAVFTDS